ncbi:hypothetical protein LSUE1_G008087 [Lachnellula suecica]|uniref:Berberine/berberine-like domain-containing protein n=1 Tax=Lachnellula suecica TaxID=602035 RepID=A0A8T9BX47_9HELO|nr:hypothetical protein LSUE1_G008087 [Lachnellula suecica]
MLSGLTAPFLAAVANESTYYGALSGLDSGILASYDVEPFLTSYGQYATDSAFPHADSPLPLNVYYAWELAEFDEYWRGVMQQSVDYLSEVARSEEIWMEGAYVNYALSTYTGNQIYGVENAARLRVIQDEYDPDGVMSGLAGGFVI